MRCYCTPIKMSDKCEEKWFTRPSRQECEMLCHHSGKELGSMKPNVQLPEDPASSFVGIYPREMQANRDLNF